MGTKHTLDCLYYSHHLTGNRYGFVHHLTTKANFFSKMIGEGKRILDLGCRDGSMTKTFVRGNEVIGIDVDAWACSQCHLQLNIKTLWHDLNEPLPFDNGEFDVVVLSDVLEHVWLTSLLLEEIQRVLKTPGQFLGSTPNAFYWINRWKLFLGQDPIEHMDPTHVRYFSMSSLARSLKGNFGQVDIIPYGKHGLLKIWPEVFASDFFWQALKT